MGSWRRLAGVLGRALSSPISQPACRLHCVRRESSLTVQLDPDIKRKDFLRHAFVGVDKKNRRRQAAHIGYTVSGRIHVHKPVRILRQNAFAVVQIGAKQFKVTPGDILYVEKLKYADINDLLSLNKVLLVGTKMDTIVGRPFVENAAVSAIVEEHALDARVIVFKKKRRKKYRRCKGHRQMLTRIRITRIRGLEQYVEAPQESSEESSTKPLLST